MLSAFSSVRRAEPTRDCSACEVACWGVSRPGSTQSSLVRETCTVSGGALPEYPRWGLDGATSPCEARQRPCESRYRRRSAQYPTMCSSIKTRKVSSYGDERRAANRLWSVRPSSIVEPDRLRARLGAALDVEVVGLIWGSPRLARWTILCSCKKSNRLARVRDTRCTGDDGSPPVQSRGVRTPSPGLQRDSGSCRLSWRP